MRRSIVMLIMLTLLLTITAHATPSQLRLVMLTVRYIDQATGRELCPSDTFSDLADGTYTIAHVLLQGSIIAEKERRV